jgi:two-component system response regulator AtoC
MKSILVIDDEEGMRHMLSVLLAGAGYRVSSAESGGSALKALEKEAFDFILCDVRMPDMGGLDFLGALAKNNSDNTVIMMSAYGTVDTAIECMKRGAYDYISKPFKTDEILLTIRKAEERERLKRENRILRKGSRAAVESIVTSDPAMNKLIELARRVADYDTTVLVTGESGTGKELVARAIHYGGSRSAGPFVAVNCGAIPSELIESELFGYVKGAFTDAVRNKPGLFHEADGGTIFLDEVGDLPFDMQVKLLRVLEEKEVRRVGDTSSAKVDVKVVAATARDLAASVASGRFRDDLYYRLNVINLKIPALRERPGDIPLLASRFTARFAQKFAKDIKGVSDDAMKALVSYRWPGNVRELENVIERAVILEDSETLRFESLPFGQADKAPSGSARAGGDMAGDDLSIRKATGELERKLIVAALERTGGNRTKAAKLLEMSHRALLYKIKDYGL